jgi:hypothetical protein
MIDKELQRHTQGHGYEYGYEYGYECDLEGGDPYCKIQPPYETVEQYISRLLLIIESYTKVIKENV